MKIKTSLCRTGLLSLGITTLLLQHHTLQPAVLAGPSGLAVGRLFNAARYSKVMRSVGLEVSASGFQAIYARLDLSAGGLQGMDQVRVRLRFLARHQV
ncbi:hypothetical protein KC351_g22 [Hortaea werneckii]|nr:hypothetical protein KC351_g22 [Hortaea werneckii]